MIDFASKLKPDILLVSDGSGYKDGYSGYAIMAWTPDKVWKVFRMGGMSGFSVDRAEFTGCLEGLQMAWAMWGAMPQQSMTERKPVVQWMSDRENLILSAKCVQERSNCPDLWARYEYYETIMTIQATFVNEQQTEAMQEFRTVDVQASIGREMIKNYLRNMDTLPPSFLIGM